MTDDDIEKIEKVWNSLGFAFGLTHDRLLFAQALLDAAAPAADTELQPYLRQYRHNDGSDGFVFAYEKEGTDRLVAHLTATLRRLADLADGFNVSGVYFSEDKDNLSALNAAFGVLGKYRAYVN